jgi:nucleotide-binding universal stress UspA family protein
MSLFKKILAPTDFSDLSAVGVRYACRLAKDVGAHVLILNVVLLDESNKVDKQELARHKLRLEDFVAKKIGDASTQVKIRKLVDAGHPYGTIREWANNERVDLIVMSSHGRSGLSRMLIGSVTDKTLRGAPCPVLVVPSENQT